MNTMTYRKVSKVLQKAGYQKVRQNGSHVQFQLPGSGRVITLVRNGNEMSKNVLCSIEKATGLSLRG